MSRPPKFGSWLAPHLERYVSIRRAAGAAYDSGVLMLEAFDRFVHERGDGPPLTRLLLLDYLVGLERLSMRARDNVVCVIWPALAHASRHGVVVELPPRPPIAKTCFRLREPQIIGPAQVVAIMTAARALPSRDGGLRPATTETLIGLLWTTGMRIGEALALDVGDLDLGNALLTIRHGKFGKSRALPLRASTVEALERYLVHRSRRVPRTADAPFLVSCRRRRLSNPAARENFHLAAETSGLSLDRSLRPHDLRHSFAVQRVSEWYRAGGDVQGRLAALSTYLGHVSVESTRVYLRANGLLLEHASQRFEQRADALDGVRR